ncbi:MAG: transposase [Paenisporosarcina sp.]
MAKIYVSVAHHQYYYHPEDSPWEYEIEAGPEVYGVLNQLFNQKQEWEGKNFFRAHLPYIPYHLDPENDEVDLRLKKIYALIHEYGNKEAKALIESMPFYAQKENPIEQSH